MRIVKQGNLGNRSLHAGGSVHLYEEQGIRSAESTTGVPFQLIFGPRIGEGLYLNIGERILQLLGIGPGDFTEKLFQGMITGVIPLSGNIPPDPELSRRKFIKGEIRHYIAELLMSLPGGARKWILDTSVPVLDEETGRVIGSQGMLYDDTCRAGLLDRILKENRREEESESLKAAFLRNISHEIRTPLNAIVGFSTLLGEYPGSPDKQKEFIEIISRSSDHLLALIDDIMEMSKIESGNIKLVYEQVDLPEVLHKVYDHFRKPAAVKGINLTYLESYRGNEAPVYSDSFRIMQVLRYLVSNAIKFTSEGKVEFGYKRKDDVIELWVTDTGIGIPDDEKTLIFNRFYQGDTSERRRYSGTGLGLTIARSYVELLGGQIWFTSQEGEGSEFRFMVPVRGEK